MNRTAMLRVTRVLLAVIIGLGLLVSTPVAWAEGAVAIDLFTVSADGQGYTYDNVGQRVTITDAGDYIVTGGGVWNSLAVAADIQGQVNLTLQGVNIALRTESQSGTPLTIGAGSTVNLTLDGVNSLSASGANGDNAGILVEADSALTISGSGSLTVTGWGAGAGIGPANKVNPTGTITVSGGTVTATGGQQNTSNNGSGIRGNIMIDGGVVNAYGGSALATSGAGLAGTITINDGKVVAVGGRSEYGYGGAGIGGAGGEAGGIITIHGGDVTATGGDYGGAGIGGGYAQPGGTIHIDGGSVKADGSGGDYFGGNGGAGIGGGGNGGTGGIITIGGSATVVARGKNGGAGIGGGSTGNGGSVTISGGHVRARGDQGDGAGGAGVGGGYGRDGVQITISGGTVEAQGGFEGAGIGGATHGVGGQITISGGQVTATGGYDGSGIGSGRNIYSNGGVTGGTIKLTGGTITATGAMGGAGIGAGSNAVGGSITIGPAADTTLTVTATGGTNGGAGIGGGLNEFLMNWNGSGGTIAIRGGTVTALGKGGAAGIGGGKLGNAGNITISGGRVTATVTSDWSVPGIGAGAFSSNAGQIPNALTISGGRVYATGNVVGDIGGDSGSQQPMTNTFTGGSIRAGGAYNKPTNGSQDVYRTAIAIKKPHNRGSLTDRDIAYFLNGSETDVEAATDDSGYLYLWLPEGAATVLVQDGDDFYDASGTVSTNDMNEMTAIERTYEVSGQDDQPLDDQTLEELYEGYGSGGQQTADINIKNYGTMPLENFTVTVNEDAGAYFDFVPLSAPSLATEGTAHFQIAAKQGLASGTYHATVTISADKMQDVTLNITQVVKLLTVSFYNLSDDAYATAQVHYNMGVGSDWPVDPQIRGYDFAGWYNTADQQVKPDTPIAANLHLEARWTPHIYTITYDLGGGTVNGTNPGTYTIEDAAITLKNPTKEGYTFDGWSGSDITGKTKNVTFEMGWIGDRSYTANWTVNKYTVAYNGNGSNSGTMAAGQFTYGVSAPLAKNTFGRTGYTFAGWALSKGGAAAYQDCATVVSLSSVSGGTVTMYAQWTANKYAVVYNGNGANSGSMATSQCTYGVSAALAKNTFVRTGYTFAGWKLSTAADKTYNDGAAVLNLSSVSGGTVTMYAQWTANKYLVAYNGNGANSGSMTSGQFTYGISTLLAKNAFVRTGYTFAGWALSKDGAVAYKDVATVVNLTSVNGGTVTLYARWTKITYQITYTLAGGTVASPNPASYDVETPTFTLRNPTRTGYTFAGWSGTGITGMSSSVTIAKGLTGNRAYTANWKINVTFVSNGGTAVPIKVVANDALLSAPSAPTRTGYKFVGWYKTSTFTTPWNFASDRVKLPTTLYARWLSVAAPVVKPVSTGYTSIKLTWSAVSGADKYEVWRATAQAGPYVRVGTVTTAVFADAGLVAGKVYYYKVLAVSQCLSTVQSGNPTVVSIKPVPATPVSVKAVRASSTSIQVTWAAVDGASGYELCRATSSSGVYSLKKDTTATAYTNTGLKAGSYSYYKVRAYRVVSGARVYSDYSVVVSAKP